MKDWSIWLPAGLPQFLKQETFTCSNHAPIDSIETQELAITGVLNQYSRRWLSYVSKTSPTQGNSEQMVFPAIGKYGLVKESSWPQRKDMTIEEYYTPPNPQEQQILLSEGQEWLKKWEVIPGYFKQLSDLNKAPLIVRVNVGSTFHFLEVLNPNLYYDSEYHNGNIGVIPASTYPKIVDYHQIIIKLKGQSMQNLELRNDNGTYFIIGIKDGKLVKAGLANNEVLQVFLAITDQITTGPTNSIPQVKVIKNAPALPNSFVASDK